MTYPDTILKTEWADYRTQEIHFESQGKPYIIIGENLLRDITEFAYDNHIIQSAPYIRVNGFEGYEYYPAPSDSLIKLFIIENYKSLNIYTIDGDTIQEGK